MAQNAKQLVNGAGNISFNIRVPDDVMPGIRKVSVKDEGGRIGEATITVAKPEITLDPTESLVGSEVTVSGTGFPANDLVLIKYANNTVDTAATSSTGTFSQTITVPSGNDPGTKADVEAVAQVQDATTKASAEAKHKLPDATISLSPEDANAGGSLTITGSNYQGFRQISLIEVGGQTVTPVPAPSTDKWGAFSATVQVPQLTPGRYAVLARVGDEPGVSATEFIQVVVVAEEVEVVADPSITIDPTSGEAGSSITVTGSDFAAGVEVLVRYGATIEGGATPGDDGSFTDTFTVPADAVAGTNSVTAGTASAEHTLVEPEPEPEPEVVVVAELSADPAEVTPGDDLTISGANLSANQPVVRLNVGGMSVLPDDLITDPDGSFTTTVTTPELEAGEQEIEAIAGGERITTMVTVLAVVPTDPAGVFADLIADGSLSTVWHLNAATQSWTSFSTNPALADFNDLTEIQGGQVYVLIMSAAGEFQGKSLFAGTNQVFIP